MTEQAFRGIDKGPSMVSDPGLGDVIARYERDEGEASHSTMTTLFLLVAGAVGVFIGGLRLVRNQSNGIALTLLGGGIFWVGLMLFRGARISLESVELGENGLRWNDQRYPVMMRWSEIEYIEVVRSKENDEVRSLFLCQDDDTGQLLSRGILRDFDQLVEQLNAAAKEHEIPFRPA